MRDPGGRLPESEQAESLWPLDFPTVPGEAVPAVPGGADHGVGRGEGRGAPSPPVEKAQRVCSTGVASRRRRGGGASGGMRSWWGAWQGFRLPRQHWTKPGLKQAVRDRQTPGPRPHPAHSGVSPGPCPVPAWGGRLGSGAPQDQPQDQGALGPWAIWGDSPSPPPRRGAGAAPRNLKLPAQAWPRPCSWFRQGKDLRGDLYVST